MDQITFLGTGGARVVMSSQVLSTGGFILEMNNTLLSIDPGPGAIVHAARLGFDLESLEGVLLSHRHLDHCGDANVMVEAMTHGGFNKSGLVLLPGRPCMRTRWFCVTCGDTLQGSGPLREIKNTCAEKSPSGLHGPQAREHGNLRLSLSGPGLYPGVPSGYPVFSGAVLLL